MTSVSTVRKRSIAVLEGSVSTGLAISGCDAGGGSINGNLALTTLTVRVTDEMTSLNRAESCDNGSFSMADSAKVTSPSEFIVVLKKKLTFANDDMLTSSDVTFSFDRQPLIADQNGPSRLRYEEGSGAEVLGAPKHPHTRRLIASLPVPNPAEQATRREELRMLRAEA